MDRFFKIVDSQTFDSSSSETFDFDVREETFNQYMRKIPIWDS